MEGIENDKRRVRVSIEAAIRIALLALLVGWCFLIFQPFLLTMLWGMIIGVASYPLFVRLQKFLGGKSTLAAAVFVIVSLAIIVIPSVLFTGKLVNASKGVSTVLDSRSLELPPPTENVKEWPLVGNKVFDTWAKASSNLESFVQDYGPEIKDGLTWLLGSIAGMGIAVIQFIIALLIAGLMLANREAIYAVSIQIFDKLTSGKGKEYVDTSAATIRSVTQGVLGVAVIQALLSLIILMIAGVPYASVWALLVLIVAIMQLPSLIILAPIMFYVSAHSSTGIAIFFIVGGFVVGISDNFLKPLFLGRGMSIPMLVILIGAIGGMIVHGIIGLFIGSVVLALGYQLLMSWINERPDGTTSEEEVSNGD